MLSEIIFYTGLALFIVHEMDAVKRKEWRMFIFLSRLENTRAYQVFAALHIPFFAVIFWGLFHFPENARQNLKFGLNIFYVIHFILHVIFLKNEKNEFISTYSWGIITGMFIIGMIGVLNEWV